MICPLTNDSCKARKLRVIIFQKGVVEMQRVPKRRKRVPNRCKAMQARNHERYLLKAAVAANGASQVTAQTNQRHCP
jgi:hypothetical protein